MHYQQKCLIIVKLFHAAAHVRYKGWKRGLGVLSCLPTTKVDVMVRETVVPWDVASFIGRLYSTALSSKSNHLNMQHGFAVLHQNNIDIIEINGN